MDNLVVKFAVLLQTAAGDEGRSGSGDFVKAFPDTPLDNEVRLAGFVFKRDERDASSGAGALAE